MSSPLPEPLEGDAGSRQGAEPPSIDEALPTEPATRPPIALQLLLVPLMVVVAFVAVCGIFSWLAHRGSPPEELLKDFDQLNDDTWQKALALANLLRAPGSDGLRRDSQLARRLAAVLDQRIDNPEQGEEHLRFRIYLCRALGEFYVADGLPTLLRAVRETPSIDQWLVRRAALEAIGHLTDHVGASTVEGNEQLLPVLRQIAQPRGEGPHPRPPRARLRATTAFVLGLLESDQSLEILAQMLSDPDRLVRYNAAAGLARRGDARAVPELINMLDRTLPLGGTGDGTPKQNERAAQWNRRLVISNALRASKQLAEKNHASDLSPLAAALERLMQTNLRGSLRVEADQLARALSRRRRPAEAL
jgi:HEAT repeat protein